MKRRSYSDSTTRAYRCRSARYKETVTRVITYMYRTIESLQKAMANLRNRYRKVQMGDRKLVSGLYQGTIIVTV